MLNKSKNQPIIFGKPATYGSSKGKTLAVGGIAVVLIGLIVSGGILGNTKLWWFTKGYSARQVSSAFMGDILNGEAAKAYQASSNNMQKLNTSAQFSLAVAGLKNPKVKINPAAYVVKNNVTTVAGILTDPTTKESKLYGINIVSSNGQNKVDSLTVVSVSSKTALKQQYLALLSKL